MARHGVLIPSPISGVVNENLANGFHQYGGDWHPYSASITEAQSGVVTRIFPIVAPHRTAKGSLIPSYFDVFYNRIHVTPSEIDLGNVVGSQEFEVYVWNAHFIKKRLNAISGIGEGILVEGQQAPYIVKPLQELSYKITVTPDGSSVIDDHIIWDFNDETPTLHIKGDRIVAFSFMPDWSESITERLEWSTDILTSETGVEQRSSLYAAPRRYLNANFYLYENERQLFNNMASWHAKSWAVPLWFYLQQIKQPLKSGDTVIYCDTQNIEFKDSGLAFLYKDLNSYEIAEISTVKADQLILKRPLQNAWSQGTRLYPAIAAMLSNVPSLKRRTDTLQQTSIEFRSTEVSSFDKQAPSVLYQNYPVFDLKPEESEDLTSEYQQILATLDNKMALPRVTDMAGKRFYVQSYRWLAMGRVARAKYRALIYFLNGQQKALWIPSHADDLTVVDIVNPTDPALIINHCGYSRYAQNDTDKKHLYIVLTDGTIFCREVMGSFNEGKTERLLLNEPLGRQLKPKQIARISYMRFCRLASDTVEIKHLVDSEGVARSNLTFKKVIDHEL